MDKKLRVAFDVQPLTNTMVLGIGHVMLDVLDGIVEREDAEMTLLYFSKGKTPEQMRTIRSYGASGATLIENRQMSGDGYSALWMLFPLPYTRFFTYDADVTHFQNNYVPPKVKGRVVLTLHDILPLLHPDWVGRASALRARLCQKISCKRADHIITVSEYSKEMIVRYCGINPDKISVISNSIDTSRFNLDISEEQIKKATEKYCIKGEYYFYIGSVVTHKNLAMLIKAYAKAYAKRAEPPTLVIGGNGSAKESLIALRDALGMKERIQFIGYVDESFAPVLMRGARAFVFPSLYEGFGLPPLEAMACGTPVLCSNAASLPEVTGEAAMLLSPQDEEAWRDALLRIDSDDALKKSLNEAGIKQAARYSSGNMAEKLMEIYRKLAKEE